MSKPKHILKLNRKYESKTVFKFLWKTHVSFLSNSNIQIFIYFSFFSKNTTIFVLLTYRENGHSCLNELSFYFLIWNFMYVVVIICLLANCSPVFTFNDYALYLSKTYKHSTFQIIVTYVISETRDIFDKITFTK